MLDRIIKISSETRDHIKDATWTGETDRASKAGSRELATVGSKEAEPAAWDKANTSGRRPPRGTI